MSRYEGLNILNERVVKVLFFFFFRAEAVLQHIAELNPYVHVTSSSIPLNETTDLSFLDKYQVGTLFYVSFYIYIYIYSCKYYHSVTN